jgi:hypothetical protein
MVVQEERKRRREIDFANRARVSVVRGLPHLALGEWRFSSKGV